MNCQHCGKRFKPVVPWIQKYCSRTCCVIHCNATHYARNKTEHNANSRAWAKAHPRKRRAIYLRYQRKHSREIYLRNRWRESDRRARVASRKVLLKIRLPACEVPGVHKGKVECHHRDANPKNLVQSNLMWLCVKHHRQHHMLAPIAEALVSKLPQLPRKDRSSVQTSQR